MALFTDARSEIRVASLDCRRSSAGFNTTTTVTAKIARMAMTTRSSMSVNPRFIFIENIIPYPMEYEQTTLCTTTTLLRETIPHFVHIRAHSIPAILRVRRETAVLRALEVGVKLICQRVRAAAARVRVEE